VQASRLQAQPRRLHHKRTRYDRPQASHADGLRLPEFALASAAGS